LKDTSKKNFKKEKNAAEKKAPLRLPAPSSSQGTTAQPLEGEPEALETSQGERLGKKRWDPMEGIPADDPLLNQKKAVERREGRKPKKRNGEKESRGTWAD